MANSFQLLRKEILAYLTHSSVNIADNLCNTDNKVYSSSNTKGY